MGAGESLDRPVAVVTRLGRPFPAAAEAPMTPEALVNAPLARLALGKVVCMPALDDLTLLDEFDARRAETAKRAAVTGTPARRYVDAAD